MRTNRKVNSIAAGSMADIAFLLLIFFLVTTTILDEKGILVKLPAWDPEAPSASINERNVLNIYLSADNQLMAEAEILKTSQLKDFIKTFITNSAHSDHKPIRPSDAIISLKNDRATAYAEYISVYDAIMSAYHELRNEKALVHHFPIKYYQGPASFSPSHHHQKPYVAWAMCGFAFLI